MKKKTLTVLTGLSLAFAGTTTANATELVFQFQSPSFGGNPMNASFLQYITSSQNDKKAPSVQNDAANGENGENILEGFEENIRRQILSRISIEIVNSIFGDSDILDNNSFEAGGFQIDVSQDLDGVLVKIEDIATGNSSTIKLPYF